jgi:uncharacterized protein (DUF3820 family)
MKPPEQATCPFCQGTRLFSVRCLIGPHFSRLGCSDCGRHIKYEPAPWSLERARAFVTPFGKFKGRSVGDLADDKKGRPYLAWAAENLDGNAAVAAAVVLGLKSADMEVAS